MICVGFLSELNKAKENNNNNKTLNLGYSLDLVYQSWNTHDTERCMRMSSWVIRFCFQRGSSIRMLYTYPLSASIRLSVHYSLHVLQVR